MEVILIHVSYGYVAAFRKLASFASLMADRTRAYFLKCISLCNINICRHLSCLMIQQLSLFMYTVCYNTRTVQINSCCFCTCERVKVLLLLQMDLSSFINKSECECLNESDDHPMTHALTTKGGFLESDCDEQVCDCFPHKTSPQDGSSYSS